MLSKFGVRSNIIRLMKSNFSLYRILIVLLLLLYEFRVWTDIYNVKLFNYEYKSEVCRILFMNMLILILLPAIFTMIIMLFNYLKDKKEEKSYQKGIIERL